MPQALSAVHVHAVFSTKDRIPFISDPALRQEMHQYIGGICKNLGCPSIIVGVVEGHVHILAALSRTVSQADWIKEIKRSCTLWVKPTIRNFAWQGGYGIFSVGNSQLPTVREYIATQEEHHRKGGFKE